MVNWWCDEGCCYCCLLWDCCCELLKLLFCWNWNVVFCMCKWCFNCLEEKLSLCVIWCSIWCLFGCIFLLVNVEEICSLRKNCSRLKCLFVVIFMCFNICFRGKLFFFLLWNVFCVVCFCFRVRFMWFIMMVVSWIFFLVIWFLVFVICFIIENVDLKNFFWCLVWLGFVLKVLFWKLVWFKWWVLLNWWLRKILKIVLKGLLNRKLKKVLRILLKICIMCF